MRKAGRFTVGILAAAVMVSGSVCPVWASDAWYDGLKLQKGYEYDFSQASEYGYVAPVSDADLTAVGSGSRGMLGAAEVPASYMTDLSVLMSTYPGTRSQGKNDCWAFSAVGLAEFDMITDDKLADKSVDYSELQVAYFTYHNTEDPLEGTYGDSISIGNGYNYLTLGGNLAFAARSLMQWKGITQESVLPYANAASTRTLSADYAYENNAVHLQNVEIMNIREDTASVKQAIMAHGAVGIGYHAAETAAESGQYQTTGSYNGQMVPTVYCSDRSKKSNHAVNIVGWDDAFPAENFSQTPAGSGAWLVRNSWSDTTGYQPNGASYFWLSYYDATIENKAWMYDFEPADNYDYNYQYDGLIDIAVFPELNTVANVFTVRGQANELLRAVSVSMMQSTDVPYTIKVYTNLSSGSKPGSGALAATVTGRTTHAGVYTIPLEKAVPLAKGTKYSVVVELGSKKAGVDVECSYADYLFATKAYIDPGQSFALKNGSWKDMEELNSNPKYRTGNFCIKAYTDGLSGKTLAQTKNLKKSSVTKSSITLSWSKVSGADGYEIYRATSKNGTYKKVATVKSGKKVSYKNTGLSKNKTYYYRVRAYKKNSVSGKQTTTVGKMSSVAAVKTSK